MRKVKLFLELELDVVDGITDSHVYQAISNAFAGNGYGLQEYPGEGPIVATDFDVKIYQAEAVWTSYSFNPKR